MGEKVIKTLQNRFENCERNAESNKAEFSSRDFFKLMREEHKVSDETIKKYWNFAVNTKLIIREKNSAYVDLNALFKNQA